MALRLLMRATMRWGILLAVIALLGCQRGSLQSVLGDVELSSRALHFEPTFVGYPTTQPLVLRSTSRGDRAMSVVVKGPFAAQAEVTVPGGAQRELIVRFEPLEAGPAMGSLTLSDGQRIVEIALEGEGVIAAPCASSSACVTSAFDPLSGKCVDTAAADGASCVLENACFLGGGTCSKGLCLGAARDCADTDLCTVDACDPVGGCVHLPMTCAAPKDPCKAASCDSALGCVVTDAADGTACGDADCVTAHVCILGACKTLPVPDGATCASESPCQGPGICQQQVCQRPVATPLVQSWSYEFPGLVSGFRGVTDSAENLYWVECAFGGLAGEYCDACTRCAATSYTRNGQLRFRRLLSGYVGNEQQPLHLIAGDQLVYAMPASVGAVAIADGSPKWTRDLSAPLANAPDSANLLEVKAMAADPTGIYLLAARYQGSSQTPRQSVVVKLEPSTGAVLFTRFFDGPLMGAVIDDQNNVYFGFWPRLSPNPPPQLVSLNSAGTERWRATLSFGGESPVAAFKGELIMNRGEVRSTLDGSLRVASPGGANVVRNPLMGAADRTLLIDPPSPCCPTCPCPAILPRFDAIRMKTGSSVHEWQKTIAAMGGSTSFLTMSDAVATRQGDLLIAGSKNGSLVRLVALNAAGAERFACEIPQSPAAGPNTPSLFDSPVALVGGKWAVVEEIDCPVCLKGVSPFLRVFEVPGERPPLHGWVGAGGSSSGGSRPLP